MSGQAGQDAKFFQRGKIQVSTSIGYNNSEFREES